MIQERRIGSDDLLERLDVVLDEISHNEVVFIVETEETDWKGRREFILGPLSVCGAVFGLFGQDYGWPDVIDVDSAADVRSLAPAYRRHPLIVRDGDTVAVAIQIDEYQEIKQRSRSAKP